MSWREQAPEPSRLWIRWIPRRWPAPPEPALDLAARRLLWPAAPPVTGWARPAGGPPRPDLVWLSPVPAALSAERDALARELAAQGSPVLVQGAPGSDLSGSGAAVVALDLTAPLLAPGAGGLERLRGLSPQPNGGARLWVVLPLIAGVTPDGPALAPWLDAVETLAPDALVLVTPELEPVDRRRLAEASPEARYEEIFHGAAPAEREVARAAARRGLDSAPRRPPAAGLAARAARNRELAAVLGQAGELWLRLGRPEPEGQALLAAARHLETTPLDVAALAREGNLGVLDWLSAGARPWVAEGVDGALARLASLRSDWLGADRGDRP